MEVCLEERGGHHNREYHQGQEEVESRWGWAEASRIQQNGLAGDLQVASGEVTLAIASRGQNCLNQDFGVTISPNPLRAVYSRPGLSLGGQPSGNFRWERKEAHSEMALSDNSRDLSKHSREGPGFAGCSAGGVTCAWGGGAGE